jgi:hypothetical protein
MVLNSSGGRLPEYNELPGILKRQINNREFLKRDPEAQNIVNTLDDRPDVLFS